MRGALPGQEPTNVSNHMNAGQHARTSTDPQTESPLAARLRAQLPLEPSRPWLPEPGDELLGTFVQWTTADSPYGQDEDVAVIATEDGEHVWVWCTYKVLKDSMRRAAPQPGEKLLLQRGNDRESKAGKRYRFYAVAVDREAGA